MLTASRSSQAPTGCGSPTSRHLGADEEPSTTTRWIEFLHEAEGAVAGRGLAIVISDAEIDDLAKSSVPRNQVRLDELQSGEYIRLWLNRGGSNYLVHMPTAAP